MKFVIKTTHEGTVFDGTGKKKGNFDGRALTDLSEVRFSTPGIVEVRVTNGKTEVYEGGQGDA